ncbi:hypothetical protein HDV05_007396 [Chytridiales sp. JEL 0842]|nr:hypothetical protein HDV05_007396 [Chytridiales sp. JEL 0842]
MTDQEESVATNSADHDRSIPKVNDKQVDDIKLLVDPRQPPPVATEDIEDELDLFEDALAVIFQEPVIAHGKPGGIYNHTLTTAFPSLFKRLHPPPVVNVEGRTTTYSYHLPLRIGQVSQNANNALMAHYIWQSAHLLSLRILNGTIKVQNERVVELGSGAGLVSLACALSGAQQVIASDYSDEGILKALEGNLESLLGGDSRYSFSGTQGREDNDQPFWDVVGHCWGDKTISKLLRPASKPSIPLRIMLADVLWMPDLHHLLLSDLYTLLSEHKQNSVAHIASGLHTGRLTIEAFVRKARAMGFTVRKLGEARVDPGGVDVSDLVRKDEASEDEEMELQRMKEERDPTERKRWILLYDMWLP